LHITRAVVALLLSALVLGSAAVPGDAHRRAVFPAQSLGNRGIDVVALQHLLRSRGYQLAVDGTFGSSTQAAVASFQRASRLDADGVVRAATWEKLVPQLGQGARGEAVTALQKLLNKKNKAGLSVSASFDGTTRSAVRTFQKHMGLNVTGTVNRGTWRNLLWHFVRPSFSTTTLCSYHSGNGTAAHWGTGAAVGQLEAAGARFYRRTGLKTSVGELSWQHGGNIPGHATHEVGLDVDIGLIRRDGRHCRRLGLSYKQAQYDRAATRELIKAIYATARGQLKLIYFNDPVLVREGLVVRYPNHNDHMHVRYCEVGHAQRRYRCPAPKLPSSADLDALLAAAAAASPSVDALEGVRLGIALQQFLASSRQ
jgi:peptidoglycan hydrolase-like protein with peptidoglycan-binding domain